MKGSILLLYVFWIVQSDAQTLFSYGRHKVSVGEFLNAYQRNKTAADSGKDSMKDYLRLYINYKLKVQDAKDIKLDTLPSLQADLQSYRHQIENNYVYDLATFNRLTTEAVNRSKKDIQVTAWKVSPERALDEKDLKSLAEDVFKILRDDPDRESDSFKMEGVKVVKTEMGFITAFTLPYEIENIIYSLHPGEISNPFLFQGSYFIFKNEGERQAMGKIKLAQILITAPTGDEGLWKHAALLADSLYHILINGGDFSSLAKEFSDDRMTYFNGGVMPEFGVGKYSPDFEARAFSLKNPGEISRPFKTIFGYHIIKLISSHPVVSDKAEELAEKVRQQVVQDSRMNIARNKLISTARIITGFHSFHLPEADVYKITDSSLIAGKDIASGQVNKKSILFKFNDGSEVSLNDWIQYAKNSDKVLNTDLHHSYQALWPEFESYQIVNNYKSHLDQFDRDFSRQMQEFKEGNMLFEMMQRKVWNLASEDSVGLKKYYQLHSERYRWKESADVIIFSCSNEEVAQRCINELRTMPWDEVLKMNAINLQADSGRFEIDQLPVKISIEKAGVTPVVVNDFDKTATFLQVLKIYPGNIQRDFNDARGLVVEDYQTQLENDWIKKLRLKYPVTINQKAWSSIQK